MGAWDWRSGAPGVATIDGKRLEMLCHGPARSGADARAAARRPRLCRAVARFSREARSGDGLRRLRLFAPRLRRSDPVAVAAPARLHDARSAAKVCPRCSTRSAFGAAFLLGHSDGASIAAIYAGSVEDFRVRGLVLMAPHVFTEPQRPRRDRGRARQPTRSGDLQAAARANTTATSTSRFAAGATPGSIPAFNAWNVADVIDYWRVPALAIQGADDQYGTLAQIREIETRAYSPVDTILDGVRTCAASRTAGGDARGDRGFLRAAGADRSERGRGPMNGADAERLLPPNILALGNRSKPSGRDLL